MDGDDPMSTLILARVLDRDDGLLPSLTAALGRDLAAHTLFVSEVAAARKLVAALAAWMACPHGEVPAPCTEWDAVVAAHQPLWSWPTCEGDLGGREPGPGVIARSKGPLPWHHAVPRIHVTKWAPRAGTKPLVRPDPFAGGKESGPDLLALKKRVGELEAKVSIVSRFLSVLAAHTHDTSGAAAHPLAAADDAERTP